MPLPAAMTAAVPRALSSLTEAVTSTEPRSLAEAAGPAATAAARFSSSPHQDQDGTRASSTTSPVTTVHLSEE
jgi:hypothetical protein